MQLWYGNFFFFFYKQSNTVDECVQKFSHSSNVCKQKVPHHNCTYNCLPVDEPYGPKHVEDLKKNLKLKY
jgi:hypothetical protein